MASARDQMAPKNVGTVGTVDLLGGSRISFFVSPVCIYLFQSIGTGILIIYRFILIRSTLSFI